MPSGGGRCSPPAAGLGTATVFAFPLLIGAVAVGALEIYWTQRPMGKAALIDGLLFADAALLMLITELAPDTAGPSPASQDPAGADQAGAGGGFRAEDPGEPFLDRWPEVHQAAGMMSVQREVGVDAAYARLRAYAYANDQSLRACARQVVQRTLRFPPDSKLGLYRP